MSAMASQITSLTIVYSSVCSHANQRKHQSSASLAFVRGIHRWPVNSPHKVQWCRKCFHLMMSSYAVCNQSVSLPGYCAILMFVLQTLGGNLVVSNVNTTQQGCLYDAGVHFWNALYYWQKCLWWGDKLTLKSLATRVVFRKWLCCVGQIFCVTFQRIPINNKSAFVQAVNYHK